jgi:hypothetical protein
VEAHYIYSGEEGGVTNKKEKVISVCENITDIDAGDEQTSSCSGLIVKVQNDIAALAATGEGVPDITDREAEQVEAFGESIPDEVDELEAITSERQ